MRTINSSGHGFDRVLGLFAGSSRWTRIRGGSVLAMAVVALGAGSALAAQAPQREPDAAVQQKLEQGAEAMTAAKFSEAVADYTAVTSAMPRFPEGYLNLGLALEQAGRLDDASAALEKAVALKPDLRGANLFLGLIAYRRNQFKQAESRLLRETRIDPRDAKAFMWLGVCYLAEGRPADAIPPLDKAHALDPANVDILYHRGHAYLQMANASYAEMFKVDHDSMRVHQVLAEAYAKGYRTQQAIEEFELAVKKAPHEPGLHAELADQYWIAGQLDKAEAAYRQELAIDPYSAVSMYKLGSLLVLNNQPADGVKFLRDALRADPTLSDAHYYLGNGLMKLSRGGEAIQQFRQAIAADPSNDRAMSSWYKLALVYRNSGQAEEAHNAMGNFLRMKKDAAARQDRHTEQLAQSRTSLPVPDPARAAILSEH